MRSWESKLNFLPPFSLEQEWRYLKNLTHHLDVLLAMWPQNWNGKLPGLLALAQNARAHLNCQGDPVISFWKEAKWGFERGKGLPLLLSSAFFKPLPQKSKTELNTSFFLFFNENFFPNIPSEWLLDFAQTLLGMGNSLTVPWGNQAIFEQIQL